MKGIVFWQFALNSLIQKKKLILMTVAESSLSSPGKQGFKMLINEDTESIGTVGGGIMEKQLLDSCKNYFDGNQIKQIIRMPHSNNTKLEKSGLICGGFQTVLFTFLNDSHIPIIYEMIKNIKEAQEGLLTLRENSFSYNSSKYIDENIRFIYSDEVTYKYEENIGLNDTAFIVGGGHVGLAVSEIMKFLDFNVVIFDHRKDIFTLDNNSFADEKIITDYKSVSEFIRPGNKSYVIIVTPQHTGDKDALGSVINMELKYIGMMGSKKKINTVFNNLIKEGIKKEKLEKVHTPIGLGIGAESPNEIAISIASEIIKIKNSRE